MPCLVYVLKSIRTKKHYVGQTENLQRRLLEHNKGRGLFDRLNAPFEIICIQEYPTRILAVQRERFLKTSAGRKELKLLIENARLAQLVRVLP